MRIERIAAAKGLLYGEKLAHALGVTYETLRKWREGLTAPNRTKQQKIAEYLGVPPAEFMHGIVGMHKRQEQHRHLTPSWSSWEYCSPPYPLRW
jgi:transcriptional regulator with XRE-family HTH domain